MLSIGLMSGTSMDGIDAALIETDIDGQLIKEHGHVSLAYSQPFKVLLKSAEYAIRKESGNTRQAASYFPHAIYDYLHHELEIPTLEIKDYLLQLNQYLAETNQGDNLFNLDTVIKHSTLLHRQAVSSLLKNLNLTASEVSVVGYHGQTMFHRPEQKISIIVGDGQLLANELGIKVVNDFRSHDIAYGGLGAPLAPLYHQALAKRDALLPAVIVNCGGIANLTIINSESNLDLIAYDTGPGNGLIDRLIKQRTHGKEHMDRDGRYGKKGKINESIVQLLYKKSILIDGQPYYTQLPPKALDIGDMQLIPELKQLPIEDACATLEAFTADSIVNSLSLLRTDLDLIPKRWILSGGGWHNPVICRELHNRLKIALGKELIIQHANEAGWNSQAIEAQIFAYLAICRLLNKPYTFPNTTRVTKPISGGQLWIPN